ncbi:MAG TPA: hypothetical protein VFS88_04285 [Micavibrio sp.]|nr:hypothetical protein [Micavibrio sp.]
MMKELGKRICIIGPSNSGKSTLAQELGRLLDLPVFHLDRLAHKPYSNWERVPDDEFVRLHDDIAVQDDWIIDGNYSVAMPQRFARADTVIWLDPPLFGCIIRYAMRSLMGARTRPGGLDGAKKEFGLGLVKFTLFNYPRNKKRYKNLLVQFPHLKIYRFNRMIKADRDLV